MQGKRVRGYCWGDSWRLLEDGRGKEGGIVGVLKGVMGAGSGWKR